MFLIGRRPTGFGASTPRKFNEAVAGCGLLSPGVIQFLFCSVSPENRGPPRLSDLTGADQMNFFFTYLSVAITFVAIDLVWLKTMAERLYRPVLGDLLRTEPNLLAAGLFYIVYPIGLLGFAVLPAHYEGGALRAFTAGMMFGCFTYATYDLTNQATLRNWSTALSIADICWGSLLAGLSAWIGYLVAQRTLA